MIWIVTFLVPVSCLSWFIFVSQYRVLPVRDLRPGVFFLPLWNLSVGRGFLRHECRQAVLWRVQEHPVRPMPQPNSEQGGFKQGGGRHDTIVIATQPEWFSVKSSGVHDFSRESWIMLHGLFSGTTFITLKPFSCATFEWPSKLCTVFQQFIIVTYILAFIWLAVFAFSAIPVFFLFNMEQTCHDINILAETTPSINQHGWICMDARQYGALLS